MTSRWNIYVFNDIMKNSRINKEPSEIRELTPVIKLTPLNEFKKSECQKPEEQKPEEKKKLTSLNILVIKK